MTTAARWRRLVCARLGERARSYLGAGSGKYAITLARGGVIAAATLQLVDLATTRGHPASAGTAGARPRR